MIKWLKHNTPLIVGIVICVAIMIFAMACNATGESVLNPGKQVTAAELQVEVKQVIADYELTLAKADASFIMIKRKDEFAKKILEFAAITMEAGTINPTGIIGLAGWVLGTASYVNGRKKDTIIARDKSMMKAASGDGGIT